MHGIDVRIAARERHGTQKQDAASVWASEFACNEAPKRPGPIAHQHLHNNTNGQLYMKHKSNEMTQKANFCTKRDERPCKILP